MEATLYWYRGTTGYFRFSLFSGYTVFLTGYSHIDSEWLWRLEETANVRLGTFRNVSDLMSEYHEISFEYGPAFCYELVERNSPIVLHRISKFTAEGEMVYSRRPLSRV
jgi:alpha-mannosidase